MFVRDRTLAAGDRAATVGELLELGAGYFGQRAPAAIPPPLYKRLVHPLIVRSAEGRRRSTLEQSEVFFPYFAMQVSYDTSWTNARLAGTGVRVNPIESYFDRLMDYAVAADWGRYRPPRRRDRDLPLDLVSGVPE